MMNRPFAVSKARTPARVRALPLLLPLLATVAALCPRAHADPTPPTPVPPPVTAPGTGNPGTPAGAAPGGVSPIPTRPGPTTRVGTPKINLLHERTVRAQLHLAGFNDPKLIETVIQFVRQRDQARAMLQKLADELAEALSTPDYDPKKLAGLYDKFAAELGEERERTADAEKGLDNQLHFRDNMRLTATLTLVGVVGDAALFLEAPQNTDDTDAPATSTPENGVEGDANAAK